MPTYDYECDACGNKFEHFQSIKDPVLTKCPKCKKKKLRRLFGTGGAIMFKGSGFYITDYRSDSYKQGVASDKSSSESKSDSSKSESSKSESTKSESKTDSSSKSSESKSKSSGSKSGGSKGSSKSK
jgi:putative FmdB family regulatory protein